MKTGPIAVKAITGKVWHVAVFARYESDQTRGQHVPLCGVPTSGRVDKIEYLADVAAFRLCQRCKRLVEQISVVIRGVQS